jgi:hypothetical protein
LTVSPADEAPHRPTAAGFGDSFTYAFGDERSGLYGVARLGLVGGGPEANASGLALLFSGAEPVAVAAESGEPAGADDRVLAVGDLRAEILEPLREWRVSFDGDEGGFDLRFAALSAPAELGLDDPAARAAGLEGYEQLCRVTGDVRAGDRRAEISALGQRGHQWGAPDWDRITVSRTLSAWIAPDTAITLAAVRPADARGHVDEAVSAYLFAEGEPVTVAEPRLSTTYDGDERQRRAGLELWETEESDYPRRAAGEAVCGTTLELGRLTLEAAFFRWHMEGRTGIGRYDVLRRTG